MSSLQSFAAAAEAAAKAEAARILPIAEEFAGVVADDIAAGLEALAPIVLNAVIGAATASLTAREKESQAITDVVQQAEIAGIPIAVATAALLVKQGYMAAVEIATGK